MVIAYNEKELLVVAKKIVDMIKPGDVVAFEGDLAAGKTTLISYLSRELGYQANVSSPTFVLEHHYPLKREDIKEIIHLDLYRLNEQAVSTLDWAEFSGKDKVTFIEWPSRAGDILPKTIKTIVFEKLGEHERKLTLSNNFNND